MACDLIRRRFSPSGFHARLRRAQRDAAEWCDRVKHRLARVGVCYRRSAKSHEFPLHVLDWIRHFRIDTGEQSIRGSALCSGIQAIRQPTHDNVSARCQCGLDPDQNRRLACVMGNSTQGRIPDDLTAIKPEVSDSSTIQTHRAAFEEQALAQRMRNASAIVRAQQKVARERRNTVRQPK